MFDFTFHNPTRIIFGAGKESLIGAELNAAGIKNVLLVYGRNSVVKSGLLERVLTSLKASNIAWTQYGGVDSNPLLSHTREGVTLAKREEVDAILAVGGGSQCWTNPSLSRWGL
jgi:alcohol dehydrogenase YqhD (iron-dependent ADH family)